MISYEYVIVNNMTRTDTTCFNVQHTNSQNLSTMDSPNAPPQLYAELYFGSSSKPQHDYYLPQDTSRLTLSQHVSVCANLFSECTILLQDNDCYDSLAKLAAVFFDTQQFLVQEGKKIEKRTQNDLGLDWVWEYKLRSNPVTLCDMHYYLQTIWKSLTSGMSLVPLRYQKILTCT